MPTKVHENRVQFGFGWTTPADNARLPRHRWYSFKEAFSPELVRAAIRAEGCSAEDLVLDPFAGSGTVPLVAASSGLRSVGYEVNPFFAFLARCKLTESTSSAWAQAVSAVRPSLDVQRESALEGFSTFTPRAGLKKWLFNTSVIRTFESGWQAADEHSPGSDLIKLALIGAAMDACNAYRDGKCLRYSRGWQEKPRTEHDFVRAFEKRCSDLEADLKAQPRLEGGADIVDGDARSTLLHDPDIRFRVAITSPPYLNSFDYTDVYRPELFLGRFTRTREDLRTLRYRTVRSHVQADWPKPQCVELSPLLSSCSERIEARKDTLWDHRIPSMVQAYFEDMYRVLKHLRSRARDDGSVWMVVATSAYAGVEVPVDLILGDVGVRAGWSLREVTVLRHLRTSGQNWKRWAAEGTRRPQLRESLVVLEAKPSRKAR